MNTRRGIIGVLVATTVTGFMVMYNSTSRNTFTLSSPKHRAVVTPVTQPKRPTRAPITVLRGYTNVVDQKPLNMHCSSCSLVSSSGQLTGGGRGQEIDRAECVIRMNDAPSGGRYQRDVGRRTTLRVVAHSSLRRVMGGRRKLKKMLPRLQIYVVSQAKLMAFDELFKTETGMDRKGTNSWLSTGWFTMGLATELCGTITVFGMVPPDFCSSSTQRLPVPYHYYEPRGTSECSTYLAHEHARQGGHHRFITEKAVFAGWALTHDISFHQPDWTPQDGLAPVATATNGTATNASHTTHPAVASEPRQTAGQTGSRKDS